MTAEESRAAAKERRKLVAIAVSVVLGAGVLTILGRAAFPYFLGTRAPGSSGVSGRIWIGLLWGLAWFGAAFVMGFLFGIPKALQSKGAVSGVADPAAGGADPNGNGEGRGSARAALRVNTNLEEISDWLTKILVGATLTQIGKVPGLFRGAAAYVAASFEGAEAEAFAGAIVLYFSTSGFFFGYLITRMFLSGAFFQSDRELDGLAATDEENLRNISISADTNNDDSTRDDPKVRASAERARRVPLTDELSGDTARLLAEGAMLTGDPVRAREAALLALKKNPTDVLAQLAYARALLQSKAHSSIILRELDKVYRLIRPELPAEAREDIYNAIVYMALYCDPQEGFTHAIRWGLEFATVAKPRKPSIWINLACAFGQQYSFLKRTGAGDSEITQARKQAETAIQAALAINPAAKDRLRQLAQGSDPVDNDLREVTSESPTIRTLLDL